MTYRIVLRERIGHLPPAWVVEKQLDAGEVYTLACFTEHGPAIALLSLLAASQEVERGARVEFECFTVGQAVA